jgi:LysM repeat protein
VRGRLVSALVLVVALLCAGHAVGAAPAWTGHYSVRPGDTLTAIAQHYRVSVPVLAKTNGLDWRKPLLAGVTLRVPARATATSSWTGRYTVRPGDTLSEIAARFHISLGRLATANGLDWRRPLLAGVELRVPAEAAAPHTVRRPAASGWVGRYTVAGGDTLSGIAARYHITLAQLAGANGLDWHRPLLVGVKLRVPTPAPVQARWAGSYTVVGGDTLGGIATRFHVTLQQLASANGIDPADVLQIGTRLDVPPGGPATVDLEHIAETDPYLPGAVGYDISYPNCGSPVPAGGGFTVIGLNAGRPFTTNPCFASEWAAASRPRSVYINTAYSPSLARHTTPECADAAQSQALDAEGRRAYAVGCSEAAAALDLLGGVQPLVIWLDVEAGNSWSDRPSINVTTIRGALEHLLTQSPQLTVGVYSNANLWLEITGGWSTLAVPEWIATGLVDPPACPAPFSAGPVWLAQGTDGESDTNEAC